MSIEITHIGKFWCVYIQKNASEIRYVGVVAVERQNYGLISRLYGARTANALTRKTGASKQHFEEILNTRPDPIDQRDFPYQPTLVQLPAKYLNTTYLLSDFKVRRQGFESSCVGQALAALIDLQELVRTNNYERNYTGISARFLYENAKKYDHHLEDSLPGSSLRGAIKGFYHNGACKDNVASYVPRRPGSRIKYVITSTMRNDARSVSLGTYFRLRHVLNDYHCASVSYTHLTLPTKA